jgi:phosphatidylglycerol---prolipoprotein diacylglyceryl transferase
MYPTIYHVFYDWFGWEIPFFKLLNSFGFFVAVAFVAASWVLGKELKRKEEGGLFKPEKRKVILGKPVQWSDVIINAFIGFIMGWKIVWLIMNAGDLFVPGTMPQEHIFSMAGYPLMGLLFAALLGGWKWFDYHSKRLPEPQEKVVLFHAWEYTGSITMIAAIFGIVGAKFFHLFENPAEFMQFFKNPTLDNFLSGLTVFGGLIVAAIALGVFAWRKNLPLLHMGDSLAPSFVLAYGIGRIGCQVSGDGDWGIVNTAPKPFFLDWIPDNLWAYDYPNNVNGVGVKIPHNSVMEIYEGYGTFLNPPVFPTPIYETLIMFAIFAAVWFSRKRCHIPGFIFAICLMCIGVERFFIEKIRVNNHFDFLGMQVTQAEVISTLLFFTGGFLVYFFYKNQLSSREWKKWGKT